MHEELKQKLEFGVLWNLSGFFGSEAIRIVLKFVLAGLLIPKDFGIVSVAVLFISFLAIFQNIGASQAFIKIKNNSRKAKNTLFYIDALINVVAFGVAFFFAPQIASFFMKESPQLILTLTLMIRILVFERLIYIFAIVPSAVLNKQVKFKQLKLAQFIGTLSYVVVAIVLAFSGFGAWSMIYGQMVTSVVSTVMVFMFVPFVPSFSFSLKLAKKYVKFGKNLFVSSLVFIVRKEGNQAVVGRVLGASMLGIYHLGAVIMNVVIEGIEVAISNVLFPIFCQINSQKNKLRKLYFRVTEFGTLVVIPAIIGLVILAEDLTLVLIGEKWLPIVPIIYVLAIGALLRTLVFPAGSFFLAKGKPKIVKNLSLINFIIFVVLIYPFVIWLGIKGAAWVATITSIVTFVYYFAHLFVYIKEFLRNFLFVLLKYVVFSGIMAYAVYHVKNLFVMNILTLIFVMLVGAIVYFVLIYLFNEPVVRDLKDFIKEKDL
ncbi:lipopolysaccharide biosynthesis protein [Candidatus Woesearchaeota archaeon]|jgi:teichuronic acid exporter|nr:lipopolysaccharide biosynthesis protein [Candidatus Woesearchaeota archaeon]MBT4368516.1 lipopolysaccharide biosynthesis protein [Candidatus Woesearchaeota archaeon]MBT4713005.1 lipopolysaccharide biosynthesis protein [Candidatus Woesearchaeota archaeon]MBT6639917.1 lipopolysaccharide biosynthesis protein [Candidatus Woesearchaeota archaeon]MBT7134089.1 lipopolysaccharide biosynthesis protein [Candidatus Woesearchaeota archaeon]